MHFRTTLLLAGAGLAAAQSTTTSAPAATHTVTVGSKGNTFEPHNITAKVGDSVAFTFASSSSHDVLQAEYARPCEARDPGALFSGDLSSRSANDVSSYFSSRGGRWKRRAGMGRKDGADESSNT